MDGKDGFKIGDVVFCIENNSGLYIWDYGYECPNRMSILEGTIIAKRENEYMVANIWFAKEHIFQTENHAKEGIKEIKGEE